ncbi:hypothetical protein BC940DRAFT_337420 [Gongronella butleri]|nr:hypothetical protein BC940DRAFT_337420 [Gongronella butleri]
MNATLLEEGMELLKEFCHDLPAKLAKLDRFLQEKVQPITILTPEYNRVQFTSFVTDPTDGVLRVLAQDAYRMDIFDWNLILEVLGMAPIELTAELDLKKALEGLKQVFQLCKDHPSGVNGSQRALARYYNLLEARQLELPLKNLKPKGFPCIESGCDKTFLDSYELARHRRNMHGDPKLKCDRDFCAFETSSKQELNKHMNRKHTKNKTSPYKCFHDKCDSHFKHSHPEHQPADY